MAVTRSRVRLKPEDILWPVTERTIEAINHNFDILFRDLGSLADSVLPVLYGGTGTAAFAKGDTVVAVSSSQLGGLNAVAEGFALISQGANTIPAWGKIGLTTHVVGILPIANGGTGASDKTTAFDNLSPLTTKGDLLAHDGTHNVRLPAVSDNHMLITSSGSPEGVKWAPFLTSALIELFLYAAADDVVPAYRQMLADVPTGVDQHLTFGAFAAGTTLADEWISDPLGYDFIPDGVAHLHIHAHKHSGTKDLRIQVEGYVRTAGGVETLHSTSSVSPLLPADADNSLDLTFTVTELVIDPADFYVIKVYAVVSGPGSDPVLGLHIEGDTNSRFELPVPGGVASGTGPHDILESAVHQDAETAAVVRGALIIGASLPFNGLLYWLDGHSLQELDSGVDFGAQQFWADGAAPGTIGFSDPELIRWRRLSPAAGILRNNGIDVFWGDETPTQPRVRIFRETHQSIPDAGAGAMEFGGTAVAFEASSFDSAGFWSIGTPTKLVVPPGAAGIYLVFGQSSWDSSATGRKACWLFKNGLRFAISEVCGDDGGLGLSFPVVGFVQLGVDDYVELVVRQDTGGALDLLGDTTGQFAQLQMVRIAL